jgi:signal peptidase I
MQKNPSQEAIEWFKAIITALAIVVTIKLLFFDILSISGISMQPTLHDKEKIFVDIIGYKIGKPKRYDIIVFTPSIEKNSYFIKRIIGMPGDTVKISNGKVYINDEKLDEEYLPPNTYTDALSDPFIIDVPYDSVFVLGDNRSSSEDSRDSRLGPIPLKSIKGHAAFRILPLSRIGKL